MLKHRIIRLTAILLTGIVVSFSGFLFNSNHDDHVITYSTIVLEDHYPQTKIFVHRLSVNRVIPFEGETHYKDDGYVFYREGEWLEISSCGLERKEGRFPGEIWLVGPPVK